MFVGGEMFLLLSIVVVLALYGSAQTEARGVLNLPFSEKLDKAGLASVSWGVDKVKATITFKVSIKTTGWAGFGFSPNGDMTGADMVIGGVGPSGTYFTDRHSPRNTYPPVDKEQNYTLLSLTEADGETIMIFRRPILSNDKEDLNITDSPIYLIYAYGLTDDIKFHKNRRGAKRVNLLNPCKEACPSLG